MSSHNEESAQKIVTDWFSRATATCVGTLLALVIFALMIRFYVEMTIGQAIGEIRKGFDEGAGKVKKGAKP